jgi:GntR family transcriptional repressor for pyruvate dehydrogenase complex
MGIVAKTDRTLDEMSALGDSATNGLLPRNEKLSEVVARSIAHNIAARELLPGTTLPPESVMIEQYRVGRASLREGLRILEINGLISMKPGPGGGPVVTQASSKDFARMSTLHYQGAGATFRQLCDARRIIEPLMARLAAEEQDQALLEELRLISRRTKEEILNDVEYVHYSGEFHAVIAGASGNRILNLFGRSLVDVYGMRVSGALFPMEARNQVVHDHAAVIKAIESGNAKAAERLMRLHMEEFDEFVGVRFPGTLDGVVDWR